MSIDGKMLNEIFANLTEYHINKNHPDQSGFIRSMLKTPKSVNVIYNVGRLKIRDHMKISIGEEKPLTKIQYPFVKSHKEVMGSGSILQYNKGHR